jgi:hypothetical protein
VSREYGPVEEPGPGLGERMLETLRSWLQVPSLALGAAIATLVMVFLVPHGPKEAPLMLAVSNVVWEKPSLAGKEGFVPKEEPLGKKKVALILLTRGETQPPLPHVDEMYSKLDIAKRLAAAYDFLSPKEIKDALSGAQISGNLMAVADLVFEKIPADYVLAFEILESTTGNAVQGTLYQRGRQTDCGSISQTGLPISRMPSRITSMGVELLLEAEQS